MKKFSILFCTLALFLSVQTFAIPKGPCDVKDACCDEAPAGPFAFSYSKDIGLACPRDFYTYGEFLMMKASEEGLDYGVTNDNDSLNTPIFGDIIGLSSRSREWDWNPGFRVGFGAFLNQDQWSMDVIWTYIKIKADAQHTSEPGINIIPLFLSTSTYFIDSISARWSGDFNTFDLNIGKPYHISRYFVSQPMIGIRAAWIDQDYHVRNFPRMLAVGVPAKVNAYFKNDFWGVGIRGSYLGEFRLGSNWELFGKIAGSLLYGKFDIDAHAEPLNQVWGYSIQDSFYSVQPNAEIHCGVKWSKYYHKNQYRLSVKAAYEFHHWFEQNQMKVSFSNTFVSTVVIPAPNGDLSFNGLSFGLYLDF